MNSKKLITPEELAERFNLRIRKGPKRGELNIEYVREKARSKVWPCIRMSGSRFIRFDPEVVTAIENGSIGAAASGRRSLIIEKNQKKPSSSIRLERLWE